MTDLHLLGENTIVGYRLIQTLDLCSWRIPSCIPLPVLWPQV